MSYVLVSKQMVMQCILDPITSFYHILTNGSAVPCHPLVKWNPMTWIVPCHIGHRIDNKLKEIPTIKNLQQNLTCS
jgi:hypothetical protein